MRSVLIALLIVGILTFAAWGDSINVGGTIYKDVYVVKTASGYYICLPDSGTVLNAAISEVDENSVSVTQDREARKALYEKWSLQNEKRKFAASSNATTPPPAPAEIGVAPASRGGRPVEDDLKLKPSSSLRAKKPEPPYDPAAEQVRQNTLQRGRMVDQQRTQREATKQRRLNARKLITSDEARQGGGVKFGGAGFNGATSGGGWGR